MGATAFTFILLPLCVIWVASPDQLLKLMVVASCFEAAAALTIGSFGLQPGLMPACFFMAYVILQLLLGARYAGTSAVLRVVLPFVLLTVLAMVTSYLMPHLLAYQAYISPQKPLAPYTMAPLTPNASSINQDLYLLDNCIFLVLAALYLTKSKLPLASFVRIYFLSGFLVAALAAWQFASRMTGLPFPNAILFSNPDWAILTEQTIGSVPRINAPFTEPSSLAGYMASIVCASGWLLLRGRNDRSLWLLFVVGLLTMVLSTSSTGFAVLAVVGAGVFAYALIAGSRRMLAAVAKVGVPLVIFGGLALVVVGIFAPGIYADLNDIVAATFDKRTSASYDERLSADTGSLTALLDTYGLGVGWGSNRSSSLIPGLLAALGVPGFLVLLWFAVRVAAAVSAARRVRCSGDQKLVMDACTGALVGFLLSATFSAPTITSPIFFFMLALLIACATRVRLDAAAAGAWPDADIIPAVRRDRPAALWHEETGTVTR
jgi:hypothetical protein